MSTAKKRKSIKVLLLNPPYKETIIRDNYCCFTSKTGYLWPPIDLLYVSALLNSPDFDIAVIEAIGSKLSWKDVKDRIANEHYDVVVTLTGTVSFRDDMPPLIALKKKYGFNVYVMGNTPSFMPSEFMAEYPEVDGIFHNFLDPEIPQLLLGQKISGAAITRRIKGEIKVGGVNMITRAELGTPPQYGKFPLLAYGTMFSTKKPLTTALLTYGCPFRCSFCIASEIGYKPRSLNDVRREFTAMQKAGIREIFFQDSTFNTDPKRFAQILELLSQFNFSWSANIHSFHLPLATMRLMKRVGCHTIQVGVESGDQNILDTYAPSKRMPIIAQIIRDARTAGIRTLGYFIVGFPTDTQETVEKTIQFALEIDPDFASFSIMTPDYGTQLYRDVTARGQYPAGGLTTFDSSASAVIANPQLSPKEQNALLLKAYIHFYLRPSKILSYLSRPGFIGLYSQHAFRLFGKRLKQVIGKK